MSSAKCLLIVERPEFILRRLQCQRGTELRLPARALEKYNEVTRHGERRGTTQVPSNERQSQIDAGCHVRGCPDRTVAHEDRIGLDAYGGKAPLQTEATRRASLARCRTQSTSAGSAAAASTPWPPAIMSVSRGAPVGGSATAASSTPADAVTLQPAA